MNFIDARLTRRQLMAAGAGSALLAADSRLRIQAFEPDGSPAGARVLETLLLTDRDGTPDPVVAEAAGSGAAAISVS